MSRLATRKQRGPAWGVADQGRDVCLNCDAPLLQDGTCSARCFSIAAVCAGAKQEVCPSCHAICAVMRDGKSLVLATPSTMPPRTQSIEPRATTNRVVLDYPPTLNNLYSTVRGRRVLSKAGRDYKIKAAATASQAGMRPLSGAVVIFIDAYRPRRVGDLDNISKALLDSLKGVAWHDDGQVVEIHARRFEDKLNPRVEIIVRPL